MAVNYSMTARCCGALVCSHLPEYNNTSEGRDGPGERADSGERDQEIDCAYNSAGPGLQLQ